MQLDPSTLYYLATPYSRYKDGIWPAYKVAARLAGRLVAQGLNIYSPIAHSHPLAIYGGVDPLDHDLWMRIDAPFVSVCGGLIVGTMDGWRDSKGVTHEIGEFVRARKPVYQVDPTTLEIAPYLDRETARALTEAGYMPVSDYVGGQS